MQKKPQFRKKIENINSEKEEKTSVQKGSRKHKFRKRIRNLNEILADSETEARGDQGGGFKHY